MDAYVEQGLTKTCDAYAGIPKKTNEKNDAFLLGSYSIKFEIKDDKKMVAISRFRKDIISERTPAHKHNKYHAGEDKSAMCPLTKLRTDKIEVK